MIANGIDLKRFAAMRRRPADARPTVALIGRVVPIKDVKTFITAAGLLRERVPELAALVLGPTDEDPEYFARVRGAGRGARPRGLRRVHRARSTSSTICRASTCVALTSLSESQPLVLLEAGAAGIPFVATNVGSCREILEGRPDEAPPLGPGGIVTNLVAPAEIAAALGDLLPIRRKRRRYGETLRERVERLYTSEQAAGAYRELYQPPDRGADAARRPARQPERSDGRMAGIGFQLRKLSRQETLSSVVGGRRPCGGDRRRARGCSRS